MPRSIPSRLLLGTLLALLVPAGLGAGADTRSDEVMAKVRQALGGEKLQKLSSLSIEGTYRRQVGDREMSGDLELAFALPDKFLRMETFSFDPPNTIRRFTGFNGTTPLDSTTGGGGNMMFRMGGPGGPGGPAGPEGRELSEEERQARRLRSAHRDFGRMLAALLAGSSPNFPLEYRYTGEAESDDGKATVIDVTGPEEFAAKLFVDQDSYLPLMIMFRDAMPRMQVFRGAPGQRPSREEMDRRMREAREAGPPPQVDVQLFLADHKKVDGILLPHTIRRAVDGKTVEEWQITSAKINPPFKADKFEKK